MLLRDTIKQKKAKFSLHYLGNGQAPAVKMLEACTLQLDLFFQLLETKY